MMSTKHLIVLLLLPAALFTSCNNDDDDDNSPDDNETQIVGNWRISAIDTSLDEQAVIDAFLEENDEAESGISDALLEIFIRGIAEEFETVDDCEGDDLYRFLASGALDYEAGPLDCQDDDFSFEGAFDDDASWSINGNELTVTDSDGPQTFTIKTLNNSTMVLEGVGTLEDDDDFDAPDDLEIMIEITFSRS